MASSGALMEAQANFAVGLLREAVQTNPGASIILSPISVSIALAMAYAGARDETASDIAKVIAKGEGNSANIHNYFGSMIQAMAAEHANYTLETANRIYVMENFQLLKSYKDIINDHYLGQFQKLNFTKSTEAAKTINDFVEEKTHNKIKDLISPSDLDALTRLVLINAIYFKGNWASKFVARRTQKKTFYQAPGKEIEVDMMQKSKEEFIYRETNDYQVLGMPYKGNDVFMYIILPKERYGLEGVLKKLDGPALVDIVQYRGRSDVIVSIPKFKVESTHQLADMLKKLGMTSPFNPNVADFSGISSGRELFISDVVQKAFIETNEEGTEAAAATGVQIEMRSAKPREHIFNADHPFIYCLVDANHQFLFNGIMHG